GEHRGLALVHLERDLSLEPADESRQIAAVARRDLEQAPDVAEARGAARQRTEHGLELEALDRERERVPPREPRRHRVEPEPPIPELADEPLFLRRSVPRIERPRPRG